MATVVWDAVALHPARTATAGEQKQPSHLKKREGCEIVSNTFSGLLADE
jgi:hypothetical protein